MEEEGGRGGWKRREEKSNNLIHARRAVAMATAPTGTDWLGFNPISSPLPPDLINNRMN